MSPNNDNKNPEQIKIEGSGGLLLKQFGPADAQACFDLLQQDPEHLRQRHAGGRDTTGDRYQTVQDVLDRIVTPEPASRIWLGIWDKDILVGTINFTPAINNSAEIGYLVGANHTAHGYATKALKTLLQYLFNEIGVGEVFAHVLVGNQASKRVLEKAGFVHTGNFDRVRLGEHEELWNFRLTKT